MSTIESELSGSIPSSPRPRRILFLQTDWEMGLCRLARQMRAHGHSTQKIAFHPADYYFRCWGIPVTAFRGPVEDWGEWLRRFSREHQIDGYVVYNDARNYNSVAKTIADELGIEVFTTEQGLVRPLHVTAYSNRHYSLPDIPGLWRQALNGELKPEGYKTLPPQKVPVSSKYKFLRFAFFGSVSALARPLFPFYREQQKIGVLFHAKAQLRGLSKLCRSARQDRHIESLVADEWKDRFFLVPLQVPYDKQVELRSEFPDIHAFVDQVADSFERNAGKDQRLIFKIHPVDRGYRSYDSRIATWKKRLGKDRIHLIDRADLDLLLENARGVVTINSTVGLTALRHGAPVKALGKAIYDLPELTFSGGLNEFWKSENRPDTEKVQKFVKLLESTIQGRGTLSRRCFPDAGATGIVWPRHLSETFGFREY